MTSINWLSWSRVQALIPYCQWNWRIRHSVRGSHFFPIPCGIRFEILSPSQSLQQMLFFSKVTLPKFSAPKQLNSRSKLNWYWTPNRAVGVKFWEVKRSLWVQYGLCTMILDQSTAKIRKCWPNVPKIMTLSTFWWNKWYCVTRALLILLRSSEALSFKVCQWESLWTSQCEASETPDQISTFFNI